MSEAGPSRQDVLREHGYHRLRVKAIVQETEDTRSFVLDVPPGLEATFHYRPGQFCTFRVPIEGDVHLRSYSMSSAPGLDADLTVTVKRVPGGLVSNWFNDHVSPGDTLEVTKPAGVFCPRPSERPVVALCGGSGVTPVISIMKSVLATSERSVRMLYANRDRRSVIFDDVLDELGSRYGSRLDLQLHFDADRGFLQPDDIVGFVAGDLGADFYICGPGPFMDLVEGALHQRGVDAGQILIERFLVEEQEKHAAATGPVGSEADVPETLTIVLGGKSAEVRYQDGDTVLETARRGGLRPPFSCEAGNCATCMALLKEGTVTMRVNNALTPEEVDEGWILTCQSLPQGPTITVEYESF